LIHKHFEDNMLSVDSIITTSQQFQEPIT